MANTSGVTLASEPFPLQGPIQHKKAPSRVRPLVVAPPGPVLISEPFTESISDPNVWLAVGAACLTAGTTATPSTSIPACKTRAPQDTSGQGALQLTAAAVSQQGMIVYKTPLSTGAGLTITFTDYAFNGTAKGGNGLVSFLSDASGPIPTAIGPSGSAIGYSQAGTSPGLAGGYVGIAFDEYGGFSSPTGHTGGPGTIPETIAVRGSASLSYPYLGGYTNTLGKAASLPFSLDAPATTSRPASAPTISETLTPSGALSVSIDVHDGNGFVPYYSQTIAGAAGQPAVPASVYLGFTSATGSAYEQHQIANLTVTTLGATLSGEGFSGTSTSPNAWISSGGACLTAGTSATPSTSIPACGNNAPQDANGQGALQLTQNVVNSAAMVVSTTPFATSAGVQVTFTDDAFNGSTPGADGMTLFLSDASKPLPTVTGGAGGSLGYAPYDTTPGIANAYLGIGLDESGNFSNVNHGRTGGPGQVPETLALRGAAASNFQYIGGLTNGAGQPASLPLSIDTPSSTTRPANAPTVQAVLLPSGALTVSLDRHDGLGFVTVYSQSIVGIGGQPAVPAKVYVGFSATTDTNFNRHQITGFAVTAASSSNLGPPAFTPSQIPNLQAWFDASNPANLTQASGAVSEWFDSSGKNNFMLQNSTLLKPAFIPSGINSLGSVAFNGASYLYGSNGVFSANVFNNSSTFAVSSQTSGAQLGSLLWSGAYAANPQWNFALANGTANFAFNNNGAGVLAPTVTTSGPALWTAEGSATTGTQFIRKNGNTLSSSTGPGATVTGNYPLEMGAMSGSGHVSSQFSGQMGEVLVFNRLLSSTETAQVEGYLACKWGLQNRLPANHPYRTSCPQGGTYPSMPLPVPTGSALQDPPQLISSGGQLVFNVVASQNATSGYPQLVYNGSAIPPTLRLLPGDTLIVNLTNNLPQPPAGAGYLNDTNLHYHGLHVSPNAPGDDSIDMLAMPGQSLHYRIAIPSNHPTGLYWYHGHAHGEAERQTLAGMSGALIVDGITQYAPQVASMAERILVVRDAPLLGAVLPAADAKQIAAMRWAMSRANGKGAMSAMQHGHMSMSAPVLGRTTKLTANPYVVVNPKYRRFVRPQAASTHCTGSETPSKGWTVNGQTMPSIGIRPGEQQFWRLVNAGADTYLDVQVDNTQMQLLALDGVPLASVGNARPTVSDYVVPPASRIEFTITGPPAGTTAYLRTNCFDAGSLGPAMPAATLATIDSTSSVSGLLKLRQRNNARARVAVRGVHSAVHTAAFLKAQAATGPSQTLYYDDQFTINGQTYNPSGPPSFYAQSGTAPIWTIVNTSGQVHTFHIHQIHFLVQAVVGGTQSDLNNVGQMLDNVNVPASSANGPGSVTLKMDFTDPTIIGTFLLHCHILSHEDAGMMAQIRVGTAPPLGVSQAQVQFSSPSSAAQSVTISGGTAPFSVSGCTKVATGTLGGTGGNVLSIAPSGGGSCTMIVQDATGLIASVSVIVLAAPPALVVSPNVLSFASINASPLNASIQGGVTPYSVTGCSGIVNASVKGSALTASPLSAGSCTLTLADAAQNTSLVSVQVNNAVAGGVLDNVTFHGNNARQGWYQHESLLTTTNVATAQFTKLATLSAPSGMPALGKVYAQPLFASNETVYDGTSHNLILVATETDQVYAYDDQTFNVVWERSFTSPPGIVQQSYLDGGCQDVNPDVGITGTPVIDRNLDEMFVAVPTKENGVFHLRLHAISLKNGADAVAPVEVSGSVALSGGGVASTDPQHNFNRGGLLEANGNIYVALGSHCDYANATTHGWVLGYAASTLKPTGNIVNTTNGQARFYLGSPWMAGFGPAADSLGNLYFATGNGLFDGISSFSMSILKVPGNLDMTRGSFFSPGAELADSNADGDLGSGGVLLFPDGLSSSLPHLLIQGGKCGTGAAGGGTIGCQKYILNRDSMGGQTSGDTGAVWHANVAGGMYGGPAYFQDAAGLSHIVYGGLPLSTYTLNLSPVSLSLQSSVNVGCLECRDGGSQPIVSSNGTQAGTAIAWALKTPPGGAAGTLTLYAFDALNMSHILFSGVAGPWTIGGAASYVGGALISPVVANGRVYVPTDGSVAVFGLTGVQGAQAHRSIPRKVLR